ncbi:DNA-3-methyladenine glycosylase [Rhodococcoides corynebacterioides]|uniref:DNA-3-methyladenine glycosylase n=1 Tax=Rhodococcoides corynebacterioides TaxID=53972 RepID=UPI00083275D4|nr:DNA-3-methyladenine glycosylase [Rhodococcus corynebacterioides]MBY6352270.1 DNA-3-methyladenine glycosylase [Rhodococcus corynebacterioides]
MLGRSDPVTAARRILGGVLRHGDVAVRIVEVEAYGGDPAGPWPDPAAHSFRGPTPRNSVMFGPAGRLYVYLSYGMHRCANIVCASDGVAGAVLLRAAEVVDGDGTVAVRRGSARGPGRARGPGNLGSALGLTLEHNGLDLSSPDSPVRFDLGEPVASVDGPRVGVSAAADVPWRFWIPGDPAVSAYRRSPRAPSGADVVDATPIRKDRRP